MKTALRGSIAASFPFVDMHLKMEIQFRKGKDAQLIVQSWKFKLQTLVNDKGGKSQQVNASFQTLKLF